MINRSAVKNYNKLIADLQKTVKTDRAFESLRESIIDLMARGLIDTSTERALYNDLKYLMVPISADLRRQVSVSYDDLMSAVNYYYSDLADDLGRTHHKIRAIERVNATRIGNYSNRTLHRITHAVREGLKQEFSAEQLGRLIKDKTEIASYYAETLGRTQVAGYGNACKMTKAAIGGIDHFEYVGFIRKTTRDFCRPMVGKIFSIHEIDSMRNNQIEPVRIYRGGYNCHHHWEPDIDYK